MSFLLKNTDIDLNIKDNQGKTALQIAVERGHAGIIGIFAQRVDIDANVWMS